MKYSISKKSAFPEFVKYDDLPNDLVEVSDEDHRRILERKISEDYLINGNGSVIIIEANTSKAYDFDEKKRDWVLNTAKQASLEKQTIEAADAQLTCLMSQMCAWLTIESYKPKTEQRGGNILSPAKIDEMLKGLPDSVETDLMRNAWSRATNIEFTSATTQSFAQMLGMSKDQLRVAMTEARGL